MKSIIDFINESKVMDEKWYTLKVGDETYDFKCVSNDTRTGFNHVVEFRNSDGDVLSKYRMTYYNRTWESWKFQSACIAAVEKYFGKAKKYAEEKKKIVDELRKQNPNFVD